MVKQKVLVLGGTGHIGGAIARKFASEGYSVAASGRSRNNRTDLIDCGIQQLSGDDCDHDTLNTWISEPDVVVDAATPYPMWLYKEKSTKTIAIAISRIKNIIACVRKSNASLIHISSFTTLPVEGGVATQASQGALRGMHSYFELKEKVEKEVISAIGSGLKGCVLNPTACFGPYDMKPANQAFIPMLLAGKMPGLVSHDINIIDVRNIADCAYSCIRNKYPFNQVPIFGHNITLKSLANRISELANVKAPPLQAPTLLGLAGLYWLETAYALAGQNSPYPSLPVLLLAAGQNRSQSREQLQLAPDLLPLTKTLHDSIYWYRTRNTT